MSRNVTFEKLAEQKIMLNSSSVIYEPSVFGGDGSESRKNIVFSIHPDVAQQIQDLEATIDTKKLISAIKDGTIKAKLNLPTVRVYDTEKNVTQQPDKWRDCVVNAVILIKGKWTSKTQSGLSMEVTDLQILDHIKQPDCPFL